MLKSMRFFAFGAFAVGLVVSFYLWPSGQVISEPGNSPLYAASLTTTTEKISGAGSQGPGSVTDGGGGEPGNFVTCETTCGPTCNQTTCGTTCVTTCAATCANTCAQTTCNSTCVVTCTSTCANTCSQETCNSTCVVTCSYTCEEPITLVGFTAEPQTDGIVLRWTTGSEVDNYCFVLWRTTDLQADYTNISGEIRAVGEGTTLTDYSFTDHNVTPGTTYYYKISDITTYGFETLNPKIVSAATNYILAKNYPNPFNPETVIRFDLRTQAEVRLAVFDVNGRLVRTLVNGNLDAGAHQETFDGTGLAAGVYIYRLTVGNLSTSGKMLLVK